MPCNSCSRTKFQHLSTRNDYGTWLNARNLIGEGVEIGVLRGDFSERIMRQWQGRMIHLVDPWRFDPSGTYIDACNATDAEHEQNLLITQQRMPRARSSVSKHCERRRKSPRKPWLRLELRLSSTVSRRIE